MRPAIYLFGFFVIFNLVNCGGAAADGTSDDGTEDADDTDDADDSSDDDSDSSSEDGFLVTGTVANLNVTSNLAAIKFQNTGTVSHVLAVSPETGDSKCKVIPIEDDGSFSTSLSTDRVWSFSFFDASKSGAEMNLGNFNCGTLNSVAPTDEATAMDMGTVTIDSGTGEATPDADCATLAEDMGLDSELADTLGGFDDVASRYSNPDIDGDGEADCEDADAESEGDETASDFFLDFHVRFNMLAGGSLADISDITGSFLSESTTTSVYTGTGVYVAYLNTYSSAESGSFTFADSAVTTSEGGSIAANTASSAITENAFGSYNGFGPNITSASELPNGDIIFAFGDKVLTFSDVATPMLATLTAPTGRIFPFVRYNLDDATCTSSCTLSGVSYKWLKKTAAGWTAASADELALLVADDTGDVTFRLNNNSSKTVGFVIPETSIEGTIDWTASEAHMEGVTESEFNTITVNQICGLGLSFDDKLGMRYFQNIANATGTCSS